MTDDESVIALPILPRDPVDIDLAPRVELGGPGAPLPLAGRASLVPPLMFPITPDEIDTSEVLRGYLRREAAHSSFLFLDLVVNVRPEQGESFNDLGVGVRLSCVDRHDTAPIAWSLSPLRASAPMPIQSTVSLSGKLAIVEPRLERKVEAPGEQTFIVAFGLRESDFEWRYTPTRHRVLSGPQQMQAVVKAARGVKVRADIVVSATVQLRGLGARRCRAALSPHLETVIV